MEKKTILLVDDDREDQEVFAAAFKEIDAATECVFASGAVQAIEVLRSMNEPPSCIISDYNMPATNGAEFVSLLKNYDAFRSIPIVVYSTAKPPEDLLTSGAWKLMIKPSTYSGLMSMLGALLSDLEQTM